MNDFDVLKELLNNDAVIDVQDGDYGKPKIILSEPTTNGCNGYEVPISQVPNQIIVFRVDKFPDPRSIFDGSKGECKRADFVIITSNAMVFIELQKSSNKTEKEIIQQFKGAQCFVDYCRSIAKKFWNKNDFLNANQYPQYFVSIKNISMNKKPTINRVGNKNTSPEIMLKISSPNHLFFNQLIVN